MMKTRTIAVLLVVIWFVAVSTVRAQPPATGIAQGSLAEVRHRPFVFPDIRDGGKRKDVLKEICNDPDGALVAIKSAADADFTLAFINRPKADQKGNASTSAASDAVDPSWITSDHKGQMIAYRRSAEGQLRILWMDPNGSNRPGKAMKELLNALGEDRRKNVQPPRPPGSTELTAEMVASLRPKILYKEKAPYTNEARSQHVQGTVVLSMVFNANGQITDFRVIRGLPGCLTASAIQAARKIRFEPALRGGKPVTVRGNIEFNFTLY